ncbi:MAG: hypothetical protein EOL92_00525 [Bacteroidia bacterium]|nr:hypothetical protein [Bacteroidia bacterium]
MSDKKQRDLYFRPLQTMATKSLTDDWYAIAYEIEQVMYHAGARPGVDYTLLDVMRLAQPLVLELFKRGELEYVYPANTVIKKTF